VPDGAIGETGSGGWRLLNQAGIKSQGEEAHHHLTLLSSSAEN